MNKQEISFITWRAWCALPIVGIMLMFMYICEFPCWILEHMKDFFFETAEQTYKWARTTPHETTS